MRSSATVIASLGVLLELVLLIRGTRGRSVRHYKLFFAYILSCTVLSPVGILLYWIAPSAYDTHWYWPAQFATLAFGYGVLLEILNQVLAPYPGAEKFARVMGVGLFAAIFCFALIAPRIMPQWSPGTVIEFERDIRCVQALFIGGLLGVTFYYGIPVGQNMKGMMLGYGLYILTSLTSLAVRAYAGAAFNRIWYIAQPLSFDTSLAIWLVALWSYSPNPAPDPSIHLEEDYEALVGRTRNRLGTLRSYLGRTMRW